MQTPYNHILEAMGPYKDKIFLWPLSQTDLVDLENRIGKSFPSYFREFLLTFGFRQDLIAEICKKEQDFISQYEFLPRKLKKQYIAIGGSSAGGDTWLVKTDDPRDQNIYEFWHEEQEKVTPIDITFSDLIKQNLEDIIQRYDKLPFNHQKYWCVQFSIETRDEKRILEAIGASITKGWSLEKLYDSGVKSYKSEFILNSKIFGFKRSEYSLWKKPSYYFNLREPISQIRQESLIRDIDKKLKQRFKGYKLIEYGILPFADDQSS